MARRPRADTAGSWHHVINRAIAKRPYFETRSDKRYFLSRLATEVRAGRMEIHAFSLMTTHFHLLVRSPVGELSEAMRRAQCAYSRYFNRRLRRDGPLIRARFYSKRVESDAYRRAVVRYIDANAVRARIVPAAEEHEFGSARAWLVGPRPRWLASDWIEGRACELAGTSKFGPSTYLAAFGLRPDEDPEALSELIELRMASTREADPIDDLVGKSPREVRRWMIRKARLADGMAIGLPVCAPRALVRAVQWRVDTEGEWLVARGDSAWRGSQLALTGLLRGVCGLPLARIARMGGISVWRATRQVELHRSALAEGGEHADAVSAIVHGALGGTSVR